MRFLIFILVVSAGGFADSKREEAPLTIVVIGATGDLAARKVMPALSHLAQDGSLPKEYAVVGVGRRTYTHEDFRSHFESIDADFKKRLFYSRVDFEETQGYEELGRFLSELDRGFSAKSNRIYFLATQASFFAPIVKELGANGLIADPTNEEWSRVMIEKPFGHDLDSALRLQESISQILDESQVYRIDHYLGKEGVQNLLDFRLRGKFAPFWNNRHIDHIQITISEEIGIGTRARFWEETGLLRDVVQNHLLQIISILAADFDTRNISYEKAKVLSAIRSIEPGEIVRGQYGPGNRLLGYQEEEGVPESSHVETFTAAKLWIDNERWESVPFYIRAGKRLKAQTAEAAVYFKSDLNNPLVIRIQPDPAIFWEGEGERLPFFNNLKREAYETLFLDCIQGDRTRFVDVEEQIAAWRLVTPVLQKWEVNSPREPFPNYPAGTWGPEEAMKLITEDGREWRVPLS